MRILVTGGRGYLGGRISKALMELGHDVTITTRNPQLISGSHLGVKILSPNWNSKSELQKVCYGNDLVIHAAGVNAQDCQDNPSIALEFNGNATGRLVRAAEESEVKTFIYLSTAHVYSNRLSGFIDEETPTVNEHPYATSHLLGESKVLEGCHTTKKLIIRLSNVYGAPSNRFADCWGLFINDISRQVATQKSITLKSDGSQERDFLPLSDLLGFLSDICQSNIETNLPVLLNFGSGNSMALLEVANKVSILSESIFGFAPEIEIGAPSQEKSHSKLSFSTLHSALLSRYRTREMDEEILELLQFVKHNFATGL
jgi:UDP-glucose 4-epimerase